MVRVRDFLDVPKNLRQKGLRFLEELGVSKDLEYFILKTGKVRYLVYSPMV